LIPFLEPHFFNGILIFSLISNRPGADREYFHLRFFQRRLPFPEIKAHMKTVAHSTVHAALAFVEAQVRWGTMQGPVAVEAQVISLLIRRKHPHLGRPRETGGFAIVAASVDGLNSRSGSRLSAKRPQKIVGCSGFSVHHHRRELCLQEQP
jgi:hypothetical protein